MPSLPVPPNSVLHRLPLVTVPPLPRLTVCDLFQRHMLCLSRLPGEISQFEETGFGYEWRCQLSLQEAIARGGCRVDLQLQFSLLDLEGRQRPAAALYLVEERAQEQERMLVELENPDKVMPQLAVHLRSRGAGVQALTRARSFVDCLSLLRGELAGKVDWS